MAYKLRFVQRFKSADEKAFLALEGKFADLERADPKLPSGRRYLPHTGREAGNTLVWECEFPTLREVENALKHLSEHPQHETLLRKQKKYFEDAYTEIYRLLEFKESAG